MLLMLYAASLLTGLKNNDPNQSADRKRTCFSAADILYICAGSFDPVLENSTGHFHRQIIFNAEASGLYHAYPVFSGNYSCHCNNFEKSENSSIKIETAGEADNSLCCHSNACFNTADNSCIYIYSNIA